MHVLYSVCTYINISVGKIHNGARLLSDRGAPIRQTLVDIDSWDFKLQIISVSG